MDVRLVPSNPESPKYVEASRTEWPDNDKAFFLAAGGGSIEDVLSLMRVGADVNYRDPHSGMTPLMTVRTRIQAARNRIGPPAAMGLDGALLDPPAVVGW